MRTITQKNINREAEKKFNRKGTKGAQRKGISHRFLIFAFPIRLILCG
jgi:hypothetical protein